MGFSAPGATPGPAQSMSLADLCTHDLDLLRRVISRSNRRCSRLKVQDQACLVPAPGCAVMLHTQQAMSRWRSAFYAARLVNRSLQSGAIPAPIAVQQCAATAEPLARPLLSAESVRELGGVEQALLESEISAVSTPSGAEQPPNLCRGPQDFSVVSFYRLVEVVCPSQVSAI